MSSNEYRAYINSEKWREKSKSCLAETGKVCCFFPFLTARHSHHMTYTNLKHEIPIRDIVPVSKFAHWIIHWPILWDLRPIRALVNCYLRFNFIWLSLLIFTIRVSRLILIPIAFAIRAIWNLT